MNHGNKKYFFENLKQVGDTLPVKPKNIYSLKSQAKLYAKENGISWELDYAEQRKGIVLITVKSFSKN